MNKSESKYFNTAIKVDEAFLKLLSKKELEYITVKEICLASDVSRSTFYLHYETINDLLLETAEYINGKFYSYFDHLEIDCNSILTASKEELIFITPEFLNPWLSFIKENKLIYSTVLKKFDTIQIFSDLFSKINKTIYTAFEKFGIPEYERKYVMMFYLEGLNAIVKEWIKNDCRDSIEEIIGIIEKCVGIK